MRRTLGTLRFLVIFPLLLVWSMVGAVLSLAGLRDFALAVWGRIGLLAVGVRVRVQGNGAPRGSLVVSNHISYLDVFIIAAHCPGAFVAKSEIASWPIAGTLCRLGGVIFIERDRARKVHGLLSGIAKMLSAGERVIVFPEGGIKGAGGELTPFHPMFFESEALGEHSLIPVAIRYTHPKDHNAWAWGADIGPLGHLFKRALPAGRIEAVLVFGEPLSRIHQETRKETAKRANETVAKLLNSVETER